MKALLISTLILVLAGTAYVLLGTQDPAGKGFDQTPDLVPDFEAQDSPEALSPAGTQREQATPGGGSQVRRREELSSGGRDSNMDFAAAELAEQRRANLIRHVPDLPESTLLRTMQIATQLGLSLEEELKLVKFTLEEQVKLEALTDEFRRGDRSQQSRSLMLEKLAGIPDWRHERLTEILGAEIALSIRGLANPSPPAQTPPGD